MKQNAIALLFITMTLAVTAQNEMINLPNGSSGISSTTSGSGVAIGPGFTDPEARLHIRTDATGGSCFIIDAEDQLVNTVDGQDFYESPDYFLKAQIKNNGLQPATYSSKFSVDINGKIQSGFFSPSVPDQLAVRNNIGIFASVDRNMRFDLTNGAATVFWESPGDNFQFVNADNSTVALQLGEMGQVGINTGNFFGDHDLFVDGSVYISEDDTDSCPYSLLVEGTAVAKEMYIRIDVPWCDYVFESDYNLRTLYEVEEYIEENGHLPNIPSATEIEETGIPVGEMERLLTEKVEELTLYVIELKKEIDTLKEQIKE